MKFPQYLKIWCLAFAYTLLAGLFIQLVLLVYIFPQWNAGAGMLNGLDSPFYHDIALDVYHKMAAQGWQAWELFPNKQVVAGIAAFFYYLIAPQPWSVLPLQAALNATACTALAFLFSMLSEESWFAFAGMLPFLLFPSALQWNAQLNNDAYSAPGVILFITGWAAIFAPDHASWRRRFFSLVMLLAGFGLAYLARPYLGLPMVAISILLWVIDAVKSIRAWSRSSRPGAAQLGWLLFLGLVLAALLPFARSGLSVGAGPRTRTISCSAGDPRPLCNWQDAAWLPASLDSQFKRLSESRYANLQQWQAGASNIDANINFYSAASLIGYLPRALQVGVLAPFPNMWFGSGSLASSTLMRRVSGVEMAIVYLCLAGLIPGLYLFRKKGLFFAVLLICGVFLLIYGLDVPNIGTLYRFRYPFLMCLVSMGLYCWLVFGLQIRRKRQTAPASARLTAG